MTFDRKAALPLGHRLYTSASTLASWGSGGERGPASESYESRGRRMTWAEFYAVALYYIENPHLIDTSKLAAVAPLSSRRTPKKKPPVEFWTAGREYRFPESVATGLEWKWLPALGADVPANARRRSPGYTVPTRPVVRQILAGNDGPTSEWLAERNAAGFAIDYGTEGNRIERALVKDRSPLVATLRQVTELMRTPAVAANDNAPSDEDGVDCGTGLEKVHNQSAFRPSVPVLLRAYEAGIETGSRTVKDGWHRIGKADGKGKLTGLTFMKGELVEYGDDRGRKRRPSYNPKIAEAVAADKSETARHEAAQPGENIAYTKLKAAGTYLSVQSPDAPRSLAPPPRTARAVANDNMLRKAVENTKTMPPVTRLPDGVAHEYGRLAGVADLTGVGEGKTSAPMHDALSEMDRAEKLEAAGLYANDLDVIEDILSDASFRSIGLKRRYAESSASAMGRKVVEDVLERISKKIAA